MNQRILSYTQNRPAAALDDDAVGCLALIYRDCEISNADLIATGGMPLLRRVANHPLAQRNVRERIATFYNGGPVERLNRFGLLSIADLFHTGDATIDDIEAVGGIPLVDAVAAEIAAFV
jgi:hypothetical protein